MDKSFEGLLFSLFVHGILVWVLLHLPAPPPAKGSDRTEITILDKAPPRSKAKSFVTETEKKEPELKDLKDTADYLSQFTKRVKKQLVARNNDKTRNSQPTVIPLQPKPTYDRNRVAGMETTPRPAPHEEGIGLPAPGGNQAMRQVAIGPSSIAEFIPGVEEGEFTALNTDQFTYYSFFSRINEQIRNRWIANVRGFMSRLSQADLESLAKSDRQTVVEIVISRTGEFSSSIVEHTSGDRVLDSTTVEAFRSAAPFLNPPAGMVESDGYIHLRYGFVVRFRPPFGQAGY